MSEANGLPIYCPNCALQITIERSLMGRKGQCPRCSHKFVIEESHLTAPDEDDLGTAPTIKIVPDEVFDFDLGEEGKVWWSTEWGRVACACAGLGLVGAAGVMGVSALGATPELTRFPGSLHQPLVHGSVALLASGAVVELFGRTRRFEPVAAAVPLILGLAVLVSWLTMVLGAWAWVGPGPWLGFSLVALATASAALSLSLKWGDALDRERMPLLILLAFSIGAWLLVGHLAGTIGAGV